jgi:hypothetical protein
VAVGSTVKIYYYIQQTTVTAPTESTPGSEPTDGGSNVPIPLPSFTVSPIPTPTPTGESGSGN